VRPEFGIPAAEWVASEPSFWIQGAFSLSCAMIESMGDDWWNRFPCVPNPDSYGGPFNCQTFGLPHPDSPAGRFFDWSSADFWHPNSAAARLSDWARMGLLNPPFSLSWNSLAARTGSGAGQGAGPNPPVDPEIEALDLSAVAKTAAYELKKKYPSVHFTSGRRNKQAQAHAMAANVVLNRNWIKETYVQSVARDACQKWVNENPDKKTTAEITAGLKKVLDGLSDTQLAHLSKHLSGDAFDVQPVDKNADEIKKTIRALPGLDKFLEKEGGLVRWHAQF
jgi:hypothetical protein